MRFLAKVMNVPAGGNPENNTTEELAITAGSHEEAIEKAVEQCSITGDETDTLAAWVTPLGEDATEMTLEHFLQNADKQLTREDCLRAAEQAPDEGQRKWWEDEATVFKPEAEGGGVTSEEEYQAHRQRRHQRLRQIAQTIPKKETP